MPVSNHYEEHILTHLRAEDNVYKNLFQILPLTGTYYMDGYMIHLTENGGQALGYM